MIAQDVAYYPPRRGECLKGNRMPLLAELIDIPESVQRDDLVLPAFPWVIAAGAASARALAPRAFALVSTRSQG